MMTGEVIETNESIADDLETLMKSPFDKGWMIKVKVENPGELESDLKTLEEYESYVKSSK
jgi:glycine cleavage system H protein